MQSPPNLLSIHEILDDGRTYFYDNCYTVILCPECGGEHNHVGDSWFLSGDDDRQAWVGRGDMTIIPVSGECGSEWQLCIGFHKGNSVAFARLKKSCKENSYLYFIESEWTGHIKIGRSGDPQRRLLALSTGNPSPLRIIGVISGGHVLETELHRQFDHLRGNGEWFEANHELKEFIKQATKGLNQA